MLWFVGLTVILIDIFHRVSEPADPLYQGRTEVKYRDRNATKYAILDSGSHSETVVLSNAVIIDDKGMSVLFKHFGSDVINSLKQKASKRRIRQDLPLVKTDLMTEKPQEAHHHHHNRQDSPSVETDLMTEKPQEAHHHHRNRQDSPSVETDLMTEKPQEAHHHHHNDNKDSGQNKRAGTQKGASSSRAEDMYHGKEDSPSGIYDTQNHVPPAAAEDVKNDAPPAPP